MTKLFIFASVFALAACGDDTSTSAGGSGGDGPSSGGGEIGGEGSGGSPVAAGGGGRGPVGGANALSFETDIWPVLIEPRRPALSGASDSCSGANGCHLTGAGGLSLPNIRDAYTNLIDAPSSSALCADMLQVVAGDPDASCFVVFYEDRLRDQLGWVDQAETDLVRQWVAEGAAP